MGGALVLLFFIGPACGCVLPLSVVRQSRVRSREKCLSRETRLYDLASGRSFAEQYTPALPTAGSTRFRRERRENALNHHGDPLRSTAFNNTQHTADTPFTWMNRRWRLRALTRPRIPVQGTYLRLDSCGGRAPDRSI